MDWFMIILELALIPGIMLFFGRSFMMKTPKKNSGIAFRTELALKNNDTWVFANTYLGRLWFQMGAVLTVVTIVIMGMSLSASNAVIGITAGIMMLLHLIPLIASLVMTQAALKKNFDSFGNRK